MTTKDQQLSTTIPMPGFEDHYFIKGVYKNAEGDRTTLWLVGYSIGKKFGDWSHRRSMAKPLDNLTIEQVEGLESHFTTDGSMITLSEFQKVQMHQDDDEPPELPPVAEPPTPEAA